MATYQAGRSESAQVEYERALVIELRHRQHNVEQQPEFPVHYAGQHIGTLIPDLTVDGR